MDIDNKPLLIDSTFRRQVFRDKDAKSIASDAPSAHGIP
jgi:hypothetical protein